MSATSDQKPSLAEGGRAKNEPGCHFARTPGWLLAVAAVALVVALVVAAGVRWWTHPDLLSRRIDNGFTSMEPQPLERSQITFGITYPYSEGSAAPLMEFGTNTARATATFSVCYPRPGGDTDAIGTVHGTGSRYCTRLVPIVEGTTLPTPSANAYIVATVTPRTTGRVVMTGADFDYALDRSHWYRRGVDHVDMRLVLKGIY